VVVVHDDLFISPADAPTDVFRARLAGELASDDLERLGAICFAHPVRPLPGTAIEHATLYVENSGARPACRVPTAVSEGLRSSGR
jgi:hypothetical protein